MAIRPTRIDVVNEYFAVHLFRQLFLDHTTMQGDVRILLEKLYIMVKEGLVTNPQVEELGRPATLDELRERIDQYINWYECES